MGLFLITGASGSGKTTIMDYVKDRLLSEKLTECISTTTRGIRESEKGNTKYHHVTKEKFLDLLNKGKFLEYTEYAGSYYGVSKSDVELSLKYYPNVYIIVDYNGYKQIKEKYPDAVGIFIYTSKEDCLANMLIRGDGIDEAMDRIKTYDEEMKNKEHYDYVIKNVRNKIRYTASIIENIIKQHSQEGRI